MTEQSAYRYTLTRDCGGLTQPLGRLCWVMFNPSTADDSIDDPTIRRCIGFTERGGYEGLIVVNLFAARATDPRELRAMTDPVGPANDTSIATAMTVSDAVVFAWGSTAFRELDVLGRVATAYRIAKNLGHIPQCLGMTKDGHPRHPLYVRSAQPFVEWV